MLFDNDFALPDGSDRSRDMWVFYDETLKLYLNGRSTVTDVRKWESEK